MDIIFIIGASQAFFLSVLAFNKKDKTDGDYVLAVWLFFIGLHLLDYYINKIGLSYKYPHLLGIGACFPLLQGPFLYVYTLVVIGRNSRLRPVYLLHSIPYLAFMIYFLFDFYFLSGMEKLNYVHLQEKDPFTVIILLNILILVLGPLYIVLSLLRLRKHLREIADSFSYTEGIDLKWLKNVQIGLGFIWFMVLFTNILVKIPLISDTISENIIYLSVVLAVFFLGYFGIKQQAIYKNTVYAGDLKGILSFTGIKKQGTNDKNHELKKIREDTVFRKLLDYFETEKPFLKNKLTLTEVSDTLRIPVNQLSHIINKQAGKNFFDFVNSYRVEEFKLRASQPVYHNYTLLSIAYECGFNSKATFNRVFRNYTGQTPSAYFQKIQGF